MHFDKYFCLICFVHDIIDLKDNIDKQLDIHFEYHNFRTITKSFFWYSNDKNVQSSWKLMKAFYEISKFESLKELLNVNVKSILNFRCLFHEICDYQILTVS